MCPRIIAYSTKRIINFKTDVNKSEGLLFTASLTNISFCQKHRQVKNNSTMKPIAKGRKYNKKESYLQAV